LAITNPWTLPPLFIFLTYKNLDPFYEKMLILVIFSYILAVVTTWVPKLRFLGEGQRYLELSAFPAAFLSVKFLFDSLQGSFGQAVVLIYIALAFASFITIIVIQRKGIVTDRLRTITPSMQRMFGYLKSLKTKPRLLCIPHQITTNTIYHTGCFVFVNANYSEINKISEVYPYIKKPLKGIMEKYDLDMILLNENYVKVEDLKIRYKIVKSIDNFLLIKPV